MTAAQKAAEVWNGKERRNWVRVLAPYMGWTMVEDHHGRYWADDKTGDWVADADKTSFTHIEAMQLLERLPEDGRFNLSRTDEGFRCVVEIGERIGVSAGRHPSMCGAIVGAFLVLEGAVQLRRA